MRVQTFSAVVGTRACDADCPFCISHMTGFDELPRNRQLDREAFHKAARIATAGGCTTMLLTGKGEPTLYPAELDLYIALGARHFPVIELQTNGQRIGSALRGEVPPGNRKLDRARLGYWRRSGLTTIALSTVSTDLAYNRSIYSDAYEELPTTIANLKDFGFTVRVCFMGTSQNLGTIKQLRALVQWARDNHVDQLTVRPLRAPQASKDNYAAAWVTEYGITDRQYADLLKHVAMHATKLRTLMHGTVVYDYAGQNLCMSDCLTLAPSNDDVRTLIFYPNGRLTYDWQFPGAVIFGGEVEQHG